MNERIRDKCRELNRFSRELAGILPPAFGAYSASLEKKAACERYLEKIVEAAVDLAFLVIKRDGLAMPEDDGQAFDALARQGVISAGLAARLKNAKGMRNIIAHQYGGVNDEMVYRALKDQLLGDVREFAGKCLGK